MRALLAQIKGLSSSGPKSGWAAGTTTPLHYLFPKLAASGRAVGPQVLDDPLAGQGLQLRARIAHK